jgi:hypothetical protein
MGRFSGSVSITKRAALLICLGAIILMALPSIFFYTKYTNLNNQLNNPGPTAQTQVNDILQRIGKHVLLPQNEQPSIATVTDPSKLQAQPFFANAKTGDKVIVFTHSRKTILYRPSSGKVVAIAQLGVGL